MSIDSQHPLYSDFLPDWEICRDSYRGERKVKSEGLKYLPATAGQVADGMKNAAETGFIAYKAYRDRSVFHDFVREAVENFIGMMWNKSPVIELPDALEPMRELATTSDESLEQLLRRINEQQLITGRMGLLLDMPETPDPERPFPYIATYNTETIINWDDGQRGDVIESLNLVVLDETEDVRVEDFSWQQKDKFRVLIIGDILENETKALYQVGVFDEGTNTFNESQLMAPSIRGNTLDKIPFVFINSKDLVSTPDKPPLLGLATLSMAIYRGEADYRQSLFLQGQDTLVVQGAGEDDNHRIGAGAALNLPTGGDAKFIGVESSGLEEQRKALENDKMMASNKSGQLIDTRSREVESGEALTTRIAAQTTTLNQIALAGAEGLERLLKIAAEWMGADPELVSVSPNQDFANDPLMGRTLVEYMTAKSLGAPMSLQSVHAIMKEKELTELDFEEEMDLIAEEAPDGLGGTGFGGNPSDDPDDNDEE